MLVPIAVINALIVSEPIARGEASTLDVENLATKRKDCLVLAVAGLFGRTTCGIALYDEEFRLSEDVSAGAVRKLARQAERNSRTPLRRVVLASFACGLAGLQSLGCLVHDALCRPSGFSSRYSAKPCVTALLNQRADLGVAKLCFGLTLELRIMQLDGR